MRLRVVAVSAIVVLGSVISATPVGAHESSWEGHKDSFNGIWYEEYKYAYMSGNDHYHKYLHWYCYEQRYVGYMCEKRHNYRRLVWSDCPEPSAEMCSPLDVALREPGTHLVDPDPFDLVPDPPYRVVTPAEEGTR